MTPFAVQRGHIPKTVLKTFHAMVAMVRDMPDFDFGAKYLSCHALCQSLARYYPVSYHEGRCGAVDHGWLRSLTHPAVLMDMYPVGGGVPFILFTDNCFLPWQDLYQEVAISYDITAHEVQVAVVSHHFESIQALTENASP